MSSAVPEYLIQVQVIDKIVKAITGSFDLDEVGQSIVDTIVTYLGCAGGTLLLVDEKNEVIHPHSSSNTSVIKGIVKMLTKSFRKHTYYYKRDPITLIGRTVNERKAFQSFEFADFISPEVPASIAGLIRKIARVGISTTFPVVIEKRVIGVLFISFYEDSISSEQMAVLSIFADHVAIAINNAAKYEELKSRYKELNTQYKIEKETTSILSHELKTPIAIAYNTAQELKMLVLSHPVSRDKTLMNSLKLANDRLMQGIKRMDNICNAILILREVEFQKTSVIHELKLQQHLCPILANYERLAQEKGLKFSYTFDIASGRFYGGGVQFEEVIMILLDNAFKYTLEGSIELKIEQTSSRLLCTVCDTGIGIPSSKREIIFRRFYRFKDTKDKNAPNVKGLGLGLYIAKKILENLNGSIKVQKNPKAKGTQFIVSMPVRTSAK